MLGAVGRVHVSMEIVNFHCQTMSDTVPDVIKRQIILADVDEDVQEGSSILKNALLPAHVDQKGKR